MTHFSIPEFLYEEDSFGVFLLVSVLLGGGAAWLAGRAIAATWRPRWQVACYMLILGLAVRRRALKLHFSLILFDVRQIIRHRVGEPAGVRIGVPSDKGALIGAHLLDSRIP